MEKYDYRKQVKSDIEDYINNQVNMSDYSSREEMEQDLNDKLFLEDSVTGNASGSYTCNAWKAEEYLCHNLDLLKEACESFVDDGFVILNKGAEAADVTIRCYLLPEELSEVLDEMELPWDNDDEEDDDEEEN